jgi:hypothetical protein
LGLILGAATLLGGVAAVWFFWDKIKPGSRGQRPPRFAPLVVDDNGARRYVTWRGRDPLHLIHHEEPPRQLWGFAAPVCMALRRDSGFEPQFNLPDNIRGEVVYELSPDFQAKWRLRGGSSDGRGEQILVLVPRQVARG